MENINIEVIDNISEIRKWKLKKQRKLFQSFLSLLLFGILFLIFLISSAKNFSSKNVIALVTMCLVYFCMAALLFVRWRKSLNTKVKDCYSGEVKEKNTYRRNNKKFGKKIYTVIAEIDGREIEGKCDFWTFHRIYIGSPVIFFSIGDSNLYAVFDS